MPTLEPLDQIRVQLVAHTATQVGMNVRYYEVAVVDTVTITDSELAEELDDIFAPLYKAAMSQNANWRGTSVQVTRGTETFVSVSFIGNAGPGIMEADLLPGQVAGLISLKTPIAGPRFRGRSYIPFPGETSSDEDGRPTAQYIEDLEDIALELINPRIFGTPPAATIIFPTTKATPGFPPVAWADAIVRPYWATQRRRGDFGQRNQLPF